MSIEIASAYVSIVPSARGFQSALNREIGGQVDAAGQTAGKKLGSGLLSGVSGFTKAIGQTLATGFAVGATAATALSASVVHVGTQYNALNQQATAAFKTILGSGDAAKQMMDQISEFATTSPFPKQAFIEGTQQLLGFGLATEKVIPALSAIQDAVAAVGGTSEDISQITLAMAQIEGQGKLTGQTLNQLGQYGIDAASLIGGQMGKTSDEIRDMASKPGGIPADQVWDPLVNALTERFGGAAANVKNTWTGTVDRIKAAWRDISSDLVEPFVSKTGGGMALAWVNSIADILRILQKQVVPALLPPLIKIGDVIGDLVAKAKAFVSGLNADDVSKFIGTLKNFAPAIAGISAALGIWGGQSIPIIGRFFDAFNPMVGLFAGLVLGSKQGRDAISNLGQTFADIGREIGPGLGKALNDILNALGGAFTQVLAAVTPALKDLAVAFARLVEAVAPTLAASISALAPAVAKILSVGIEVLARILGFLADNSRTLIPLLGGLATAFGLIKIAELVQGVVQFVRGIGNAASAITSVMNPAMLALIPIGFVLGSVFFQNAQNAADAEARVRGYADALDKYGNVSSATAKSVRDALVKGNQLDDANRLRISIDDISTAVNGTNNQFEKFVERVVAAQVANLGLTKTLKDAHISISDLIHNDDYEDFLGRIVVANKGELGEMLKLIQGQRDALKGAAESALNFAVADDRLTQAQADLIVKQNTAKDGSVDWATALATLRQQVSGVSDDATIAKSKVDGFRQALDQLVNPTLNVEQSTLRYRDAIQRVTDTIKENGATLDINTQAGRNNRQAILDSTQSVNDMIQAMIANGATTQQVTQTLQAHAYGLAIVMKQAGFTDQQIRDYQHTLGLTKPQIETTVNAYTQNANAAIGATQASLNTLAQGATVPVDADTRPFWKRMDDLRKAAAVWSPVTLNPFSRFAAGGIVSSPTVALFGEAGDEAVLPLSDPARSWELIAQSGLIPPMPAHTPAKAGTTFGDINIVSDGSAREVVSEFMTRVNWQLTGRSDG